MRPRVTSVGENATGAVLAVKQFSCYGLKRRGATVSLSYSDRDGVADPGQAFQNLESNFDKVEINVSAQNQT